MIEPTEADIGRHVIYHDLSGRKIEEGTISSFNERYVFVRYTTGSTAAATCREDLEWLHRLPSETTVRTEMRDGKITAMSFCEPPLDPASTSSTTGDSREE